MSDEGYNGYTNYETWLVCLNIDNDEGLHDDVEQFATELAKDNSLLSIGDQIQQYLEEAFWDELTNVIKICDTWDMRSWNKIDWHEVAETRLEE